MKALLIVILATSLISCSRTENGLVFGTPSYEKRDITVTRQDLDILLAADRLLSEERYWQKGSAACGTSDRLTLYCALQQASIEVMGRYVHRQPALQEVRFVIDDHYRNRWHRHRLIDFNTDKETVFSDIKFVLGKAMVTVKEKIAPKRPIAPLP